MIDPAGAAPAPPPLADPNSRKAALQARARELEGVFLSEMLRHAGAAQAREAFGGGIGEEQFASFLREAQARAIVARGGIGLAEHIYNSLVTSLKEPGNDQP